MLFRRRKEPGFWEWLGTRLWPRTGWRRSALYHVKRVLRLSATPHAIALGFAVGVFASITPFVGLHFVITFAVAWLIGGNMIAGAVGTGLGNPLTFPFIWAGTYQLGTLILRGEQLSPPAGLGRALAERSWENLWPLIKPMTVGAIPIGLVTAAILYVIVYKVVTAYQHARRERFASRRAVQRAVSLRDSSKEGVG